MKSHCVFAATFPAVCTLLLLTSWVVDVSRATETADANLVDVEVTKVIAQEKLPIFYEGNWRYFDHLVYYDLEGKPVTYAIVFQRQPQDAAGVRESAAASVTISGGVESLEAGIVEMKEAAAVLSDQIAQTEALSTLTSEEKTSVTQELAEQKNKAQRAMYGMDEFATVVTGATEDMPLIVKCYEGLPLAFVKKSDAVTLAHAQDPSGNWQIRRLMYLDRFTEAIEVAPGPDSDGRSPSTEDSMVVNLRTRAMARRSNLRLEFMKAREETRLRMAAFLNTEASESRKKNHRSWETWKHRVHDRVPSREQPIGPTNIGTRMLQRNLPETR